MRCVTRRGKRSASISRRILVAAFFIGSCLLCTAPVNAMETTPLLVAFPIVVSTGSVVTLLPRSYNAGYGEVTTFSSVTDNLECSAEHFMLSVSTNSGTPISMKAWIMPMNRFSWRAFGKNST